MNFKCDGCLKDQSYSELGVTIITVYNEYKRFCRSCRSPKSVAYDIFWDGKPEENLADDPQTGQPPVFFSKGQKAAYLREKGICEAGDRVHGAPVTLVGQKHKVDSRPQVREALHKVKQMGVDARHREYNRIIKEGQRYA